MPSVPSPLQPSHDAICAVKLAPLDVLKQFRSIFNAIKQHFQRVENESRVSSAQLWGLSLVVKEPGLRVSDLARAMGVHQSTSSNLVEQLCRQKMMVKQRSETDQRVVRLFPTEIGERLIENAPEPLEGLLPNALAQLPEKELAELYKLLAKLIDTLQRRNPALVESGLPLEEIARDVPMSMVPPPNNAYLLLTADAPIEEEQSPV
jgi:DNA-binding MarR family transcriptional regulator